jgi:hypothetical protein
MAELEEAVKNLNSFNCVKAGDKVIDKINWKNSEFFDCPNEKIPNNTFCINPYLPAFLQSVVANFCPRILRSATEFFYWVALKNDRISAET